MHYTETYMLGAPLLLLRPYNQLTSGQQAATIISKVNFPYCHPAKSLKTLSHEDSGVGLFDIVEAAYQHGIPSLLDSVCFIFMFVCFALDWAQWKMDKFKMIFLCVPCQDQTSMSDFGRRASVHNL